MRIFSFKSTRLQHVSLKMETYSLMLFNLLKIIHLFQGKKQFRDRGESMEEGSKRDFFFCLEGAGGSGGRHEES